MTTFVITILGLFVMLAVALLIVYPALLLIGMAWQLVSGTRRGISVQPPIF